MRRCEDEKMRCRPPLLEEPCAQTLSGKKLKKIGRTLRINTPGLTSFQYQGGKHTNGSFIVKLFSKGDQLKVKLTNLKFQKTIWRSFDYLGGFSNREKGLPCVQTQNNKNTCTHISWVLIATGPTQLAEPRQPCFCRKRPNRLLFWETPSLVLRITQSRNFWQNLRSHKVL